jgi:SAM-dependent methyltransferase
MPWYGRGMNQAHLERLASDEWRQALREFVLPYTLGARTSADLGTDVLEIGPGPGLTTDLLRAEIVRVTAVEIDDALAGALSDRLVGTNVEVVNADATAMPFEDGRFSGAVMMTMLHHVPTVDLQDRLFAEVFRVLRPGCLMFASDGVASDELESLHTDDIYNPIDPSGLADRMTEIGFVGVDVRSNSLLWACHARRPDG